MALYIGYKKDEFLDLDIRDFTYVIEAYTKRREDSINDNAIFIKTQAIKIAQAVWGDKKFMEPIETIKLMEEEEEKEKVLEDKEFEELANSKVLSCLKAKGLM